MCGLCCWYYPPSTKGHTNAHANYHKQRKEDKEKDWKVSALALYSGLN